MQCNTALKSSLGFKLVFSGITVILLKLGHIWTTVPGTDPYQMATGGVKLLTATCFRQNNYEL